MPKLFDQGVLRDKKTENQVMNHDDSNKEISVHRCYIPNSNLWTQTLSGGEIMLCGLSVEK